jgi:hypothetical protein
MAMHRQLSLRWVLVVATAQVCLAGLSGTARADRNDLVLHRLVQGPNGQSLNLGDPQVQMQANTNFRALASELGVVLAPKPLSPAESLGWSGFNVSLDFAFTSISNKSAWWQAAEGQPPAFLSTITAFVRKGLPVPLPSFEVGAGLTHLFESQMFVLGLYAKWTLNEGFHKIPFLPDLSVRGSGGRALGTRELDLTNAAVDVTLSKPFGIAGSVALTPYAGYQVLFLVLRSGEVDSTPNIDAFRQGRTNNPRGQASSLCSIGDTATNPNAADCNKNFTFDAGDFIIRHRAFLGIRLIAAIFSLTFEAAFIPGGARDPNFAKNDSSNFQQTYGLSLAADF